MIPTEEDRALMLRELGCVPATFNHYEVRALLSAARQALSPNNPAGQAMEGDHG